MEPNNRIKISSIVESQLPLFVREEYPLVSELLTEYYRSLESKGSSYDILQNIDQYIKVNNLTNLVETTTLTSDFGFVDTTINVVSTEGFPQTYGLIQIDNEIILYKSKTSTSFNDCIRGFSGTTEYSVGNTEELSFSSSQIQEHTSGVEVKNLSSLFLKEFFIKVKKQFLYGFDNRELFPGVDQNLFLKQSKDFYTSKGTDRSFEILFRVLYGKDVEVILPRNYLIEPSNAQYRVTRNFVVEALQGDPELLLNQTVFQDQYGDIPKSFGTVTDIQRQIKNGKVYYTLMLDYDFDKDVIVSGSIFGDLKIHPKTVLTDDASIGTDYITVDSTIGFPESGELVVDGEFGNILIQYSGKTINQFLNCSGIIETIIPGKEISLNTYAYGYDSSGNEVRFRITGVISEANIPANVKYYEKGDVAKILTLGYNKNYLQDNTWIFNKTVKCEVKSFTSDGEFKYTIETYDDNGIFAGDSVEVEYINSLTGSREISVFNASIPTGSIPGKSFQISTGNIEISNIFYIKRKVSKFSNKFVSDVLNVYRDFDSDDLYVTSSSLPSYGENTTTVNDYKINFGGTFSGEVLNLGASHGFITGDVIVYSPESETNTLGIQSGVYFVKKETDNEIRLARSRSDIRYEKFVGIASTSITNNTISLLKFSKQNNLPSEIDSQRLIKLLRSPENTGENYETTHGTTGILINGVEILNYKSDDYLYYGAIKTVDVLSPGDNYDVINPPVLNISPASTGLSTAFGFCGVEGSLRRIDLIDGGFDYIDTPIIDITGGNGQGATAKAKMVSYNHFIDLNPSSTNEKINLIENKIGFSTYHRFRNGELIVYNPGENTPIGGLIKNSKYYTKVVDGYTITLHKTFDDSIVGINTIDLTSYGSGNHRLESTNIKKRVSSIVITNPGSGYKNNKISIPSSGINTAFDIITTYQIPYNSGDIIYYYGGEENISGLSTGRYILTKVDNQSFKLSTIGIGSTAFDFYYKTGQYVDLKSQGSGNHIFNYDPIEVKISGKIGISTNINGDVSARVQPIIRGKVTSVFVYDGGVGYGSSEIINYNQQPNYNFNSGSGAILTPIVSNGKIVNVVINEKGNGYNSPPDLIVKGFGIGAVLTPIIQDGKIIEVKIINQGINYEQKNTVIDVIAPGSGCELRFNPQIWTINNFERLSNTSKIVEENDSVVYKGKNKNYGLQYTHSYAPRSLRKKVFAKSIEQEAKYKSDYSNDTDAEKYHSPILGWAYDGNPIYGPYGYDSPTNKKVRQILSGYSAPVDSTENRPDKKKFPSGYFVEDYTFEGVGDLDEHNGRFCVTPEFPNGIYAYFMTLESETPNSGADKKPKFPYIIGNSYKSKPIDFNFDSTINQNNFIFDQKNIIRNTNPYNTLSERSFYEFFNRTNDIKSHDLEIQNTKKGSLDSIQIISGGNNYQVNDSLIFDITESKGNYPSARVEYIKGREIVGISQSTTKILDVEFYPLSGTNDKLVGFTTISHKLSNNDLIFVDSLSNHDQSLNGKFNTEINPSSFILTVSVGNASVTGLTTYFNISGLLEYPTIRENDILTINSEKIKVLNIDKDNSRIRVLREQDSTVSTAHSAYSLLLEDPRKFYIRLQRDVQNQNYKLNRELYFDPNESLGIGTYIGFGHTITFSNPGVGLTSIVIPQKSIYLKDHQFNTGDQIKYKTNSGIGISVSTDGIDNFTLTDGDNLYVAKITNDLIGISTIKVGLGTTGELVGISQTGSTLFFVDPGTGNYHSFQTKFDNQSKGNVTKNSITVLTGSTHFLEKGDRINLNVSSGLTTTITIKYDDYNRRLVANPRDFSFVDIENNLITIENHNYTDGQKLIHTSSSPATGLEDEKIYYAVVYDKDRIRLSDSYYGSTSSNRYIVNISSSSYGTLAEINPKINIIKNQKVVIDLSDSSLSYPLGIGRTPAFDFNLYTDENFKGEYFPVDVNGTQKVSKFGTIGVSSVARVEFTLDNDFPNSIWYNLIPRTDIDLTKSKKEYKVDEEIIDFNKLFFVDSILSGEKTVVGVSSTSFTFYNQFDPSNSFLSGNYDYFTNSKTEFGEIEKVKVIYGGREYERLPFISGVRSSTGSGAILLPSSDTIGKITSGKIVNIGYNYSIDNTIKPTIKYPTILRVEPLSTIEKIEVISPGLNYNTSPDLVVIDGVTNKVVEDLILDYNVEKPEVTILKNTNGLYGVDPKIIAINNSNGLGISSVQYESTTKTTKVYLNRQFSDPNNFPFFIGDNILIEGISTLESTSKGYNSKNYDYSLFPVVGVYPSIGGSGAYIEYSLENYLSANETPGTYDPINSSGQVVPSEYLPSFKTTLSKNSFIVGESISNESLEKGTVLKFDKKNEFLTVETTNQFPNNSLIIGKTSKSQAFIKEIFENEGFYRIDSSSIVAGGWNRNTGFLNNDLQKIHDNDYYQYFSYSLKSEVPIQEWNDVVSNLNHTLGFKKFSDLVLNSSADNNTGISTSQNDGSFSAICDLNSVVDIECVQDYDLASENNFSVDGVLTSTEINFNSVILQDYSESIGNRVLQIDDISGDFNTSVTRTFVTSFNI
jgi:hypothetical protein